MKAPVIVYNNSMQPVAVLQNAKGVGYEKRKNQLCRAWFTLPFNDPKVSECQAFRYVEIYDGDERVDLFRIMPNGIQKSTSGSTIRYDCEHVLATLLDDVLFQYHQTDGQNTAYNINYVLGQQSTVNWVLDECAFTHLYSYKWENESLLGGILAIPKPFITDYLWVWDTTVYPWKLSIVQPSTTPTSRIIYRKNLIAITKEEDPTHTITRVYPLGYGEGINQLTIADVNEGQKYIDADTISKYGIKSYVLVNRKYEDAASLKAYAEAFLNRYKNPKVTYCVDGAELYRISNDSLDKFVVGDYVYVNDTELGIEFEAQIYTKIKNDVVDAPGNVQLEIGNYSLDITDRMVDMQEKQRAFETYAQGATNIDSNDYQDNCDAIHPAVIEFYIPNECVNINKCLLSYKVDKFRAYENSLEQQSQQTPTTNASSTSTTGMSGYDNLQTSYTNSSSWDLGGSYSIPDVMSLAGDPSHSHGLVPHKHSFTTQDHEHGMNHTHQVTIPAHNHNINFGIYEFEYLPNSVVIKVDGNEIPQTALTGNDIDLVSYLLNTDEKITRGTFHKVEIFPNTTVNNPNGLARITATVVKQIFIQSRGSEIY